MNSMSLPPGLLRLIRQAHQHKVFVETGTYCGGGVKAALEAGYEVVHSIELARALWLRAVANVGATEGVYLHLGDSADLLGPILSGLTQPCTVFLDGHAVPGLPETAQRPEAPNPKCPLLEELHELAKLNHGGSVVLIDDWDALETDVLDNITRKQVAYLLSLAGLTKTQVVDGSRPGSLLVAQSDL